MMYKNIKHIVFDFGGVLVNLDKERCVSAFDKIGAYHISSYVDECKQEDLFHELEIGRIDANAFCDEVRRLTGIHASDEDICYAWNSLLVDVPADRIEKVMELHHHYHTFLLSNTNDIHWRKSVEELFPYNGMNADDYFDRIFLSYEMHKVKPDCDIFVQMMDESGIKAEDTLFLDDSEANCNTAHNLGINTILVKSDEDWMNIFKI